MNFIEALKTKSNADIIADAAESMVNLLTFNAKKTANEIYLSDVRDKFMFICFAWLHSCKKDFENGMFDDRNAYSSRMCAELCKREIPLIITNDYEFDTDWAKKVCKKLSKAHRTLKQTFTMLCFYFITELAKDMPEIKNAISDLEPGWEDCPFI